MRRFLLWGSGLLAAAIFGGLIGDNLSPDAHGWFWGVFGGALGFACIRLWFGEQARKT